MVCVIWALPWDWALWTALILYPVIQFNWWYFEGRCILTILEEKLRGEEAVPVSADAEEPLNFVAELGSKICGRPIPHAWADRVSYSVLWGGFAGAALRLYLRSA